MRVKALSALVLFVLALFAAPLAAEGQPAGKVWRIGFLSPYSAQWDRSWRDALQQGLRDLGYVPGNSIVIEQRHANGQLNRLGELARELVQLKLDVIVVHGFPQAIRAVRQASGTVPIVMVANPDPVGIGLASSLARPGGNLTGLSDAHGELAAKRLQLLKDVVPSASRIAVLLNPDGPGSQLQLKAIRAAASAIRIMVFPVEVRGPDDFEPAFATIERERFDALNVMGGASGIHHGRVASLAIKGRIPTISTTKEQAEAGFLVSYGANFADLYRRAATYVDKILKGANAGDLPIEQASKFELVINLKTAKALGLTIPPSLLLRADQVIE